MLRRWNRPASSSARSPAEHYRRVGHRDDRGADRGERRGGVLADLAKGRMRAAGKLADLSMALTGRFTEHHALLCRLHLDSIAGVLTPQSPGWMSGSRASVTAAGSASMDLLTSVPGFGDVVVAAWLGEIGPAPHLQLRLRCEKLASWVSAVPRANNISARKRKHGRHRGRRHLHQADADPGRLVRHPGPGPAPGPLQPAGPPLRRGQEPGREEEGDHRDRAHPAQDRLPGAQDRDAVPGAWAPTSTPAANHQNSSRPGWSASSKSSTPAAPSPSPSAPRRPP